MNYRLSLCVIWFVFWAALDPASAQQSSVNVVTYHYDTLRTGWNANETVLTAANVNSSTFGVLAQVTLDDQVDAQPLVVNNTVYVATENNTVYAIDGGSGVILNMNHLGSPVQQSTLPGQCKNNGSEVGIQSTPVIDVAAGVMYVVTYTWENNLPVFRIHQLALSTLAEMNNTVISASHLLSDGQTVFTFNAKYQRQRAALLEANGNVYAAFASFCDRASMSRGWVLGWQTRTLTPMAANALIDEQTAGQTPPPGSTKFNNYYLSSIWMSGYGIASDSSGDLFFTTGNSDTVYTDNLQESAVRLSSDLTTVNDYFTPWDVVEHDEHDRDFSSGGLMLLPDQPGPVPQLAIAGAKTGLLYIMNRSPGEMGGYVAGGPNKPSAIKLGGCWCGPSYFTGSDGIARVVTSQGNVLDTWRVNTALRQPLILEGTSTLPVSIQDPGFFTSVSSNGTQSGTAIIWAVLRPTSATPPNLTLYAFNAAPTVGALPILYSAVAGTWPNLGGNANIVPVAANGKVYVASYRTLTIFGLLSTQALVKSRATRETSVEANRVPAPKRREPAAPEIFGTVTSVTGNQIVVQLRSGTSVSVDLTEAVKSFQTVIPSVGENVEVRGSIGPDGSLAATSMLRAKTPATWGPDIQ
jgi:hypothetical protein